MKCKKCGAELEAAVKFCPECGEKVKLFCTECGEELTAGVKFCPSCGKPVAGKVNEAERGVGDYKNSEEKQVLEVLKTEREEQSQETNVPKETIEEKIIAPRTREGFSEELKQLAETDEESKGVLDYCGIKFVSKHLYPYLEQNEKVVALRHIVHHNYATVMSRDGGAGFVKEFLALTDKRVIKLVKSYWLKPKIKSCYLSEIGSIEAAKPGNFLAGVFLGEKLRIHTSEKVIKLRTFGKGSAEKIEREILRIIPDKKEADHKRSRVENGTAGNRTSEGGMKKVLIIGTVVCACMIGIVFWGLRDNGTELSKCLSLKSDDVEKWISKNGLEDNGGVYSKDGLLLMLDDDESVYMVILEQPGYSLYGLEVGKPYSEKDDKGKLEEAGYMLLAKETGTVAYGNIKEASSANDRVIILELDDDEIISSITYSKEGAQDIREQLKESAEDQNDRNKKEIARTESGIYQPGTYEGSAKGFGGEIRAIVVTDDLGIQSVELIGDDETPGVGLEALKTLAPKFEKAGSADVDIVAGATVSSEAAIKAVQSALDKAEKGEEGLNEADYGKELEPYEGTWWDLYSQRCYMELEKLGDILSVTVHWSSGAFDDTEWSMTGTYDAISGKILYDDCTMKYIHYEDNGYSTESVQYTNGSGAIYIGNDGYLYWEDNKEQTGSDCYFEKETDSTGMETIASDTDTGSSFDINWTGTYIAEDDQAITVSSADDSSVVLTFVGYSEEGWQTRTEVLTYKNSEKTQVSDPYYYDGSLVQETVYTITETGIQVETLPSGGWADGFYLRQ